MITRRHARKLRESIVAASATLSDDDALDSKELYDWWSGDGIRYVTDQRLRYGEDLWRVLQPHTSQPTWTPDVTPSLYAKVLTGDVPLPWVQPSSTNPYMKGDRVTHVDHTWESEIDNNVWEPGIYGWKQIE